LDCNRMVRADADGTYLDAACWISMDLHSYCDEI
jgi:hypothetical protein